jgi:hypothetical protein
MNQSNPVSDSPSPRLTLKLKAGARRPAAKIEPPPPPQPLSKASRKPGAHWSDAYKERMQADMDSLMSR